VNVSQVGGLVSKGGVPGGDAFPVDVEHGCGVLMGHRGDGRAGHAGR
jgi:hypothetical protein